MVTANMVGIPLETEVKKNGVTISRTETIYPNALPDTETGNLMLRKSVFSLDLQTGGLSTEISYKYDSKGNTVQYIPKSGFPVTIIWGYNHAQPIAKIEGAAYTQVSSYITDIVNYSDTDANPPSGTTPEQAEQDLIDKLDAFSTALPNYQVTTYTYNSLVGVTSITPPSGIREYYKYDTANRLESVKDVNGNVLKEYQYHYKP